MKELTREIVLYFIGRYLVRLKEDARYLKKKNDRHDQEIAIRTIQDLIEKLSLTI